jgi:O-antigen/teichoic acid export membrane protein
MSTAQNAAAAEPVAFRSPPAAHNNGDDQTGAAAADAPVDPDAHAGRLERLVGVGVAWKLVGQIGVQGIRLLTVTVLARLLTPGDYGAAAIAIAIASFAPTVSDMGMGAALVQTDGDRRLVRSTVLWTSLAFGLGLSLLAAALAGPVGRFLGDPQLGTIIAVGGLTFVICSVGSTNQAVFTREMKFRSIELRYWFGLVVASPIAVVAAILGAGAWALVLQQIVLLASFAVALWWRPGWRPALEFSATAFRRLGSFAIRVAGGRWARLLELLVLSVLVGKLVSVPALGAWSFAMSTVILPLTVIVIPIAEVLFSAFSRLRGERERMAALWLESVRLLAAVILPLLLGLVVVAPDLIPVAFGSHWHVSVAIIQILSVFVIIRSLQSWGSIVLDAVGRPQATLWTQLASLCLTPVGVIIGSQWSVEGVAVCFVLSQLIAVEIPILILVLSELRVALTTLAGRLLGVATATVVMVTACVLGRFALVELGVNMTGRAALTIAVGAVVYALALWCFAPDIFRRVVGLGQRVLDKGIGARRRRVLQR